MSRLLWIALALVAATAASAVGPSHHLGTILAIVALAALAVACWDVETALTFLLVYMPFRTLVGATTPLPLHFAADVAVFVIAARVVLFHPRTLWPFDAIEVFGLAFMVVGVVATVHAHVRIAGAFLEIRDLFLFWLVYAAVRRLRQAGDGPGADFWERAVPLALAAIAVIGLQGLVSMLGGIDPRTFLIPGPWQHEAISRVNQGRPYGLVNNPNVFGEMGFVGLALAYSRFRASGFRPVWTHLVLLAFFLAMVVFSYSRTAWIVTFVAIAIYLVVGRGLADRVGLAATAVVLLIGIFGLPRAHHRITTVASHATIVHSAKAGRLETLHLAGSLVRRRPIGTGLGTFGSGASKVFHQTAAGIPHRFYADDNYAALLVETGVLGFLLFLLTGLAVYVRIFRAEMAANERVLVLVLFVALSLIAGTSNAWEQLNLTVYPWLALAVLVTPIAGRAGAGRLRVLS